MGHRSKLMWGNPEKREQLRVTRRKFWADKDNPKFIEMRRKMIVGMNIRPNKPETTVLSLLDTIYPGEWKYTGDGQVIIGGLNPDFFNTNGKKMIIEVFGDYWHTQKLKPYRINEGRVDVYAEYGYKTLIIWEREIKNVSKLTERIREFVK